MKVVRMDLPGVENDATPRGMFMLSGVSQRPYINIFVEYATYFMCIFVHRQLFFFLSIHLPVVMLVRCRCFHIAQLGHQVASLLRHVRKAIWAIRKQQHRTSITMGKWILLEGRSEWGVGLKKVGEHIGMVFAWCADFLWILGEYLVNI